VSWRTNSASVFAGVLPGPAAVAAGCTLGLVAALLILRQHPLPAAGPEVLRAWVTAVAACGVWLLARLVRRAFPVERRSRRRHLPHDEPPARLRELEAHVLFSSSSALDFYHRLRGELAEIALDRLGRRNLSPRSNPDAVRSALGREAFTVLLAPTPEPEREAKGLDLARLGAILEALERL
jgi:hypothetical protein